MSDQYFRAVQDSPAEGVIKGDLIAFDPTRDRPVVMTRCLWVDAFVRMRKSGALVPLEEELEALSSQPLRVLK